MAERLAASPPAARYGKARRSGTPKTKAARAAAMAAADRAALADHAIVREIRVRRYADGVPDTDG